jgi:hypothetical protein
MSQTFSMVGLDIRIIGFVAEIRVEGVRTPEMTESATKHVTCLIKDTDAKSTLIDVRMADYQTKSPKVVSKI